MQRTTTFAIVFLLIAAGVAAGLAVERRMTRRDEGESITVSRTTVRHDVEFTGRIQARRSVTLSAENTGVVRRTAVEVGDHVRTGQLLLALDATSQSLEVAKAFAERASAEDRTRRELNAARQALADTLAESRSALAQKRQTVRDAKRELDQTREVWQQTVRESGDESSAARSRYLAILAAESVYHAAQETVRVTVDTTRKSDEAARSAVTAAEGAFLAARQASASAAGPSALAAAEELARVRLGQQILRAPFDGVVTERRVTEGELAKTGEPLLTVQTTDDIEIAADVPETDAVTLSTGLPATLTLDAYGTHAAWDAEVNDIHPTAALTEGVPTFHVTLRVKQTDARLRPGLSAQVSVHVAQRENVLSVPRRAVSLVGDRETVHIREKDGRVVERDVRTGLLGIDGSVEIVSGLSEGEEVIVRR